MARLHLKICQSSHSSSGAPVSKDTVGSGFNLQRLISRDDLSIFPLMFTSLSPSENKPHPPAIDDSCRGKSRREFLKEVTAGGIGLALYAASEERLAAVEDAAPAGSRLPSANLSWLGDASPLVPVGVTWGVPWARGAHAARQQIRRAGQRRRSRCRPRVGRSPSGRMVPSNGPAWRLPPKRNWPHRSPWRLGSSPAPPDAADREGGGSID